MDKIIIIALLIPSLFIFPILLQHADAFKLTNYEVKVEVFFHNENFVTDLPGMISDFDSGIIEQNMYDNVLEPIAVGQFGPEYIVSDWSLQIGTSSDTSVKNSKFEYNPVITEINTAQGVTKATIQDQMVNDFRDQIRSWLSKYQIDNYLWKLYYDGGVQIVEETP